MNHTAEHNNEELFLSDTSSEGDVNVKRRKTDKNESSTDSDDDFSDWV